jgi:hypothetical protein
LAVFEALEDEDRHQTKVADMARGYQHRVLAAADPATDRTASESRWRPPRSNDERRDGQRNVARADGCVAVGPNPRRLFSKLSERQRPPRGVAIGARLWRRLARAARQSEKTFTRQPPQKLIIRDVVASLALGRKLLVGPLLTLLQ